MYSLSVIHYILLITITVNNDTEELFLMYRNILKMKLVFVVLEGTRMLQETKPITADYLCKSQPCARCAEVKTVHTTRDTSDVDKQKHLRLYTEQ